MKYLSSSWIEKRRLNLIAHYYFSDMKRTLDIMKSHLPASCERILDIGCGLGGIDAILFWEYSNNNKIDLWLLDKNDDSPLFRRHYTGYHNVATAYNSLEITRQFLEANGVSPSAINLVNIAEDELPSNQQFDIIMSLLSWGFHFPVDEYLVYVIRSLKKEGVLFMDIRKNTDGVEKLRAVFHNVNILYEGKKCLFVVAKKFLE
jgi:SAM-dependent methyltransferase